ARESLLTSERRKAALRVLIVGSVTRDVNVHDGVTRRALGGTVLHAARTYVDLGADCRVLTSAAARDHRPIADAFPDRVERIVLKSDATTAFENTYALDHRRTQRAPALARTLPFSRDALADVDFVHLGPLHAGDLDEEWYRCDAAPLALDLQGLTRSVRGREVCAAADPRLTDILPRCAWLKGSLREWQLLEADGIGKVDELAESSERLVTRGIEGGTVLALSEREVWEAAPPIEHCDPTGAGDVFFASYLHERALGASSGVAARAAARYTSNFLDERGV